MTINNPPIAIVPSGALLPYGGAASPSADWLLCDGSAVSRTTYAVLFAIIGTAYGAGDGSTTFNLPDLRQRFPMGKAITGTGNVLGVTGGTIDHIHNSPITTSPPSATNAAATPLLGSAPTVTHTHTVTLTASNSPFQTFNFIIKV